MDTVHFKARDCITSKSIKWKQSVRREDNISTEGYLYLRDNYGAFHNFVIINSSVETSIPRKETKRIKCYGCIEEHLNQMAHMDCPNGCLHDKLDCDLCNSD